jgi:hypothetical protein
MPLKIVTNENAILINENHKKAKDYKLVIWNRLGFGLPSLNQ